MNANNSKHAQVFIFLLKARENTLFLLVSCCLPPHKAGYGQMTTEAPANSALFPHNTMVVVCRHPNVDDNWVLADLGFVGGCELLLPV